MYDTIKTKLAGMLEASGYAESSRVDDFKNAPALEAESSYILKFLSGGLVEANQRFNNTARDTQEWQVQIAFSRSELNDRVQRDEACRAKDALISKLDNPVNWEGGAFIIHYQDSLIDELKDYFALIITFEVIDSITYT